MNVLGICCGRKNGNTEIMMQEAFQAIRGRCGADCRLIRLQEAVIRSCTGCESCVINHMKGNQEFRCVHKPGSDHIYFIEQLLRQADAVIVSAPAYNLQSPGILIEFLNRCHALGDYSDVVRSTPKVGATFTIGGADWTNFTMATANMLTKELSGSYRSIVDRCQFTGVPAAGAVVLEPEMMERMRLLGEHVADALIARKQGRSDAYAYKGEPGLCPDCHNPFLEKREDGWYCPVCMTKASLRQGGARAEAVFTEDARACNRWTAVGHGRHIGIIRAGHGKAAQNQELIAAKRKEYAQRADAVKLPELSK